jgi:hypothetical protein
MNLLKDLVGERQVNLDFADWMRANVRLDDGRPWDMSQRLALAEIVGNMSHRHMTVLKGAQTGFSTLFLGLAMFLLDQMRRNVIYFLPTQVMSNRFSTTRMDAFVNRSEYLRSRLKGTDQTGLKEIDTHFLYFLGLQSVLGAISIPSDANLYDEVDLISEENMDWSTDRIAASDLALQRFFSVGMFPGIGIDERYQEGDQRIWHVACPSCRYEQVIEDEFPGNFIRPKDGAVTLVCIQCGKSLDVNQGNWIAAKPERTSDHISYRVPQLIMPGLNLQLIWDRYDKVKEKPSKLAKFRCSVLAKPDGGDLQPITDLVLNRVKLISDYYFHDSWHDTVTGIGIDMGDLAHIAIVAPFGIEGIRPIFFAEVDVEDLIPIVQRLETAFNAGATVIDAMPYKTTSKQLVRALTRSGYIQYFKGADVQEKEEGEGDRAVKVVTVDRDESLDETTDLFAAVPPHALLPKPRTVEEEQLLKKVEQHLKRLVKEKESEDENSPAHYKKNVPNHFGMALNSARIALWLATGKGSKTGPTEYTTVASRQTKFKKGAY